MKTLALAGIGVLAQGLALASQANAEQKQFGHTVQCRKNDTGGCTGDTTNCYRAPSDYVIMRSSVQAGPVKVDRKSPRCIISYEDIKAINVTTENGMPIELEEPSTICINAHIESGSGVMNSGKGFEVQCNATFDIHEFK